MILIDIVEAGRAQERMIGPKEASKNGILMSTYGERVERDAGIIN